MIRKLFISCFVLLLMATSVSAYDRIEHVTAEWPLLTVEYRSKSSTVDDVCMTISGIDKVIQPQKIERKEVPNRQNLLVAVDTGRKLTPEYLSAIKKALKGYLEGGATADEIAILSFHQTVQLHSAFTSDKEQLFNAVKRLRKSEADSDLLGTVDFAVSLLQQHEGHKGLLVITDGRDAGSDSAIASVIDKAIEKGVVINVLCLSGRYGIAFDSLKKLAEETGGFFEENSDPDLVSPNLISNLSRCRSPFSVYKIVFDLSGVQFSDAGNTECVLTEKYEGEEINADFSVNIPKSEIKNEEIIVNSVNNHLQSVKQYVTKYMNNKIYMYASIACAAFIILILVYVFWRRTKRLKYENQPALPEQEEFSNFVIDFQAIGMTFPLPYGRVTIGKSRDNAIILQDPTVSRHHGAIEVTRDALLIEDLKSTNGIFVNKVRILKPMQLKPGDAVSFGKTEAVIRKR